MNEHVCSRTQAEGRTSPVAHDLRQKDKKIPNLEFRISNFENKEIPAKDFSCNVQGDDCTLQASVIS